MEYVETGARHVAHQPPRQSELATHRPIGPRVHRSELVRVGVAELVGDSEDGHLDPRLGGEAARVSGDDRKDSAAGARQRGRQYADIHDEGIMQRR